MKDDLITKSDHLELKYSVWIDNEWYPCEYKSIISTLYVPVWTSPGVHNIRIQVTDFAGNKKEWQGSYSI